MRTRKVKRKFGNEAKLQQVIGCMVKSRCSLDVDCNSGIIAYPAGSTVILQNPTGNAQAHVIGTTKNSVTCLSLSLCGRYLVTGESGHNPSVRVWELYNVDGQFAASQIADIKCHKERIACVRFLKGGMRVVSVGNEYDGQIAVWDWRTGRKIASSRFVSRVFAMDETEEGTCVTVGVRHLRFWYVPGILEGEGAVTLQGRSAVLLDRCNDTFVDVCCAPKNRTFAISLARVLVEFNDRQLIGTYDLGGETPFSLVLGDNGLFIGFAKGIVRSFDIETTKLKTINCKPHSLHCSVTNGTSADAHCSTLSSTDWRLPNVRALCYNKKSGILTVECSDQSLYSWQNSVDGNAIAVLSSQHFHSASIFAVEPHLLIVMTLIDAWVLPAGADVVSNKVERLLAKIEGLTSTVGARSIRISPDGRHLACGCTDGNIHVYDLMLPDLPLLAMCETHEAEVMCLEYSDPLTSARYLMASGGRDRFIHIYDPLNGYLQLASIDDLASTVLSIVFASPSLVRFERLNQITTQFGLTSMAMGADGIVVACLDKQLKTFSLQGKLVKQIKVATSRDGQLTKLKLHPGAALAAVVCTDRKVYIVNMSTGDCEACLSGMSGVVTDVAFSSDCRYLVVVSSNGCTFLWRLADFLVKKMNNKQKRMKLAQEHTGGMLSKLNEELSQTPECSFASENDVTDEETGKPSKVDQVKDMESGLGSVGSQKPADEVDDDCVRQRRGGFSATHITPMRQRSTELARISDGYQWSHFDSSSIQRPTENEITERIADCISQWNTAVDLVLHVRELRIPGLSPADDDILGQLRESSRCSHQRSGRGAGRRCRPTSFLCAMSSDKRLPRFAFRSANRAPNLLQKRVSTVRSSAIANFSYRTRRSDGSLMMFKKTRYSPEVPVRRKRHAGTTTFISSDIAEEEHAKESEGSSNEREDSPELIAQLGLPSAAKRPCLLTAEELCDDMKGSRSSSVSNSPTKEEWKHTKRAPSLLAARRSVNGPEHVGTRERGKHANCSHSASVMRFVNVRNNELPGSRHAMITVYLCTEIDGRFNEIVRVPSATVQMPVNNRSTPVNIDLPLGIGCSLDVVGKERNDYVIIRVTFSGEEDARVFGGRTLRGVPSRQAGKAEVKGPALLSFILTHYRPESLLGISDNWRRDGSLAKKIVELGKKVHQSPFVHMSIMQDCGGETSSSEDDDETKSCSSESSSLPIRRDDAAHVVSTAKACTSEKPMSTTTEDDDLDDYMKARYKYEMSLQFPKQICYRFIMKYNDQPNTSFPENKLRFVPDEPPCVSALASSPSKQPLRNSFGKSDKQPRSSVLPLKEVSSANFLNGHALGMKQRRRIVSPSKPITPFPAHAAPKLSVARSLKLRLDVPRRDLPLPEMIDNLAEHFDKCAKIPPLKTTEPDDKMWAPEAHESHFPEVEGNGIVTRLLSPPNKCFFCLGTFPDMFALLMHLRTSYPRLDVVYRGDVRSSAAANSSAPIYIDIFLRQNFDGSFEGPMVRQYLGVKNRIIPQRCTPSDRLTYVVYKSEARYIRHMPKDLSIFFNQSDREKRALKGNNAAYFGFRSRHPLMSSSQVSAKQMDQEWCRQLIIRQIEDFVDISRPEKEFIKLWNLFLLDPNNRPFGRCHMYRTCRLFLEMHRSDLLARDLRRAWVYHLAAFHETEALDADETYDLTRRLDADYDPSSDKCHVVYSARIFDDTPSTSTKRKTPAWQRAPIPGPKASILRSASVASRLSSGGGPSSDNEHGSIRRHRESDTTKYLVPLRPNGPPNWLLPEEEETS
uniref:Polycomb protein VEFS-Box domain-containing protein n=1 Tax=Parascaris univalens TaxID=6257 RepID=A0A915BC11_PARUN